MSSSLRAGSAGRECERHRADSFEARWGIVPEAKRFCVQIGCDSAYNECVSAAKAIVRASLGDLAIADNRLTAFIEAALKAGASRQQVEEALASAGWSREQIQDGLGRFAPVDFVVPVPQPRAEVSARDAFMYLLMFAALYLSAYQLGSLLFRLIELAFPDELSPYSPAAAGRGIRWATSTLIVAFPAFLFIATLIARRIADEPAQRNSAVRRWLTYLTLFVASAIIIGDLIALVFSLLNGELTVRFVLKVLVVGGLAGGLFGYYLWSAKADDEALGR